MSLILQSIDARRTPRSLAFRFTLISALVRRPAWSAGTALVLLAYCLEIEALTTLPIGFVQPVIAAGVLLLPPAAYVLLQERIEPAVLVGGTLVVLGVVLLTLDGPQVTYPLPRTSLTVAAALTVITVSLYAVGRSLQSPLLSAGIAGIFYAETGIITRLVASQGIGSNVALLMPLCVAAFVAFLAEMSALQEVPATRVGPLVLALNTSIPAVCGRLVLGERWPHSFSLLGSLACIIAGGVWILHLVSVEQTRCEDASEPH